MSRINKSKDGRIGPEPKPGIVLPLPGKSTEGTSTSTVGAQPPKKKKGFKPTMKAKKTKTNG